MSAYARLSESIDTPENEKFRTPINIDRPSSNFDFIDQIFPNLYTLRRIMSQVRRLDGKTMTVEEIVESRDIREENKEIAKEFKGAKPKGVYRLSFFKRKFKQWRVLKTIGSGEIIGYAIVKTDFVPAIDPSDPDYESDSNVTRIFEAVIMNPFKEHNYIHGNKSWKFRVKDKIFSVEGNLYAQQNARTNCCAHVAIRSAVANMIPDGDITYGKINSLVSEYWKNKIYRKEKDYSMNKKGWDKLASERINWKGRDGLRDYEMIHVIKSFDIGCHGEDYPEVPFNKYIYGSIESGYPAIINFSTSPKKPEDDPFDHAIPIFGHTLNRDLWVHIADKIYFTVIPPETRYIPSDSWLSMYIGHDDNYGTNICIPKQYLKNFDMDQDNEDKVPGIVTAVIGLLPKKVEINSVRAEAIGLDYIQSALDNLFDDPNSKAKDNKWMKRLYEYRKSSTLVLRPILIDGEKYVEHIKKVRGWNHNDFESDLNENDLSLITDQLQNIECIDNYLWMIEVSIPELFAGNFRKIGEVLISAEKILTPNRDFEAILSLRLPGNFVFCFNNPPNQQSFETTPCGIIDHVELFRCEENS